MAHTNLSSGCVYPEGTAFLSYTSAHDAGLLNPYRTSQTPPAAWPETRAPVQHGK